MVPGSFGVVVPNAGCGERRVHPPVLGEHPRIVLQPDLDDAIAFALWELAVNDEEPLADNDFSLSVNPTAVSVQIGRAHV